MSKREIVGALILLWQTTQKARLLTVTFSEFIQFTASDRTRNSKKKDVLFVRALEAAGLLKEVGEERFEISGNAKRIASKDSISARNRAAGLASARSREASTTRPHAVNKMSTPTPTPTPTPKEEIRDTNVSLVETAVSHPAGAGDDGAKNGRSKKDGRPIEDLRALMEIWNQERGRLPAVNPSKISVPRAGRINARLREEPDMEKWRSVFKSVSAWPWGLGDNPSGWKATFDYATSAGILDKFEAGAFNQRAPAQKKVTDHRNSLVEYEFVVPQDQNEHWTDEAIARRRAAGEKI